MHGGQKIDIFLIKHICRHIGNVIATIQTKYNTELQYQTLIKIRRLGLTMGGIKWEFPFRPSYDVIILNF